MEKKHNNDSFPQQLTDSFQKMATFSLEAIQPMVENMAENMSGFNRSLFESGMATLNSLGGGSKAKSKCCTPDESCPPHCIAFITRQAMAGEKILVPFTVTNTCNSQKTYRVGVRELKDLDGNLAPAQPQLNKSGVILDPGRSERVIMSLDVSQFNNGNSYKTEIVIRENEINQNICFTLNVTDHPQTDVSPFDEKKYKLKWQDWQSHFYCEPQKVRK